MFINPVKISFKSSYVNQGGVSAPKTTCSEGNCQQQTILSTPKFNTDKVEFHKEEKKCCPTYECEDAKTTVPAKNKVEEITEPAKPVDTVPAAEPAEANIESSESIYPKLVKLNPDAATENTGGQLFDPASIDMKEEK